MLFHRSTRAVSLTEKGEIFYSYAVRIMDLYEEALRIGEEKKNLRVGYFENSNDYLFSRYLLPFMHDQPEYVVEPVKLTAREAEKAFAEQTIDCLFAAGAFPLDSARYRYTHLFDAFPCVMMHRKHPLAGRESLINSDLSGQHILGTPMRNLSERSRKLENAIRENSKDSTISNENIPLD